MLLLVENRCCYRAPIGIGKVGLESSALRLLVAAVEVPLLHLTRRGQF